MKIKSFVRIENRLVETEIEIVLLPGLPQITFLGLADNTIKESVLRVKSAIKMQGFEFPKARQVIVNLRPSFIKKSSRGLDLAVALGILSATDQIKLFPKQAKQEDVYVYGEITLTGEVMAPVDIGSVPLSSEQKLITGETLDQLSFATMQMKSLSLFSSAKCIVGSSQSQVFHRPKISNHFVSTSVAELLSVMALGEHPTLLAGSPGAGKSTLASFTYSLLRNISEVEMKESLSISNRLAMKLNWRPFVNPHHTTPALALIGGGTAALPGEVSRAHKGVLLLDEMLEFEPRVLEALREPLQNSKISVARTLQRAEYPAEFMLIATTNLCRCGSLTPSTHFQCRCPMGRRRGYLEKLSGPFIDRLHILSFTDQWVGERKVSLESVFSEIEKSRQFILKSRGQTVVNARLSVSEIEKSMDEFSLRFELPNVSGSFRRKEALLRVARTFADLDLSEKIKGSHLQKAFDLTQKNFDHLKTLAEPIV